jgi:hypothetical protein
LHTVRIKGVSLIKLEGHLACLCMSSSTTKISSVCIDQAKLEVSSSSSSAMHSWTEPDFVSCEVFNQDIATWFAKRRLIVVLAA